MSNKLLKYISLSAAVCIALYAGLLGLLTWPFFQAHVVYLHRIQITWFKDLNVPEVFGFLRNQVTPFVIPTSTGGELYTWHVLPLGLYREHEPDLVAEPSGFTADITSRLTFKLLRDDPDARLVLHFHGAGGTVGSGYRVPNYRALSAGQPEKVHVLTFDYRGFGHSKGTPSEHSMIDDGIAVVDWATKIAGIPPSRILIFGQSMGTAVSLAISEHFALRSPPLVFAGTILVAPFVDVETLVATYRIAGSIPVLSPLTKFPRLFSYLSTFIQDQWPSKDRIAGYIRVNESNKEKYKITLIHAKDDYDIPFHHTNLLYWHAVNATMTAGISYDRFETVKNKSRTELGAAGSIMEWRTGNGVIREEILVFGLHDLIMGTPVITMAAMRIFEAAEPSSER